MATESALPAATAPARRPSEYVLIAVSALPPSGTLYRAYAAIKNPASALVPGEEVDSHVAAKPMVIERKSVPGPSFKYTTRGRGQGSAWNGKRVGARRACAVE